MKLETLVKSFRSKKLFLLVLLVSNFCLRLNRIGDPLTGFYEHRTTQTAFGIKSLTQNGMNPFTAEMPVFGPPWKVPFEFPMFQWFAAVLVRTQLFTVDQAGRIVASISILSVGLIVFKILSELHGEFVACCGTAILIFSSFGLLVGTEILIDGFALSLSLLAYWLIHARRNLTLDPKVVFLVMLALSISALVKINTAILWILGIGVLVLLNRSLGLRQRVFHCLMFVATLIPSLFWTRYADDLKQESPYTQWLVSGKLHLWNFGTVSDRFDLKSLSISVTQFTNTAVGGLFCFLALVILAITNKQTRKSAISLVLVFLSGPLIFITLYEVHSYYWMSVLPAAVLLASMGLAFIGELLQSYLPALKIKFVYLLASAVILGISYFSTAGAGLMNIFIHHQPMPSSKFSIEASTKIEDWIIVIGDDWSPATLYYSNRRGLTLRPGSPKPRDSDLGTLYKYVYSHDKAPNWDEYFPKGLVLTEVNDHLYKIG